MSCAVVSGASEVRSAYRGAGCRRRWIDLLRVFPFSEAHLHLNDIGVADDDADIVELIDR